MITFDGILENIIAEIIILIISFLLSYFILKFRDKDKIIKKEIKFDVLNLSIFLTFIFVFNLILNLSFWNIPELTIFFTLLSIVLGVITVFIYKNQCPACKKLLWSKKVIDIKIIKKFTKPWKYRHKKIWLYSNGKIWKEKEIGPEKIRTENWITKQEFYECRHCGYQWDSGHFDINRDERTRPEPEYIKTNKEDPNVSFPQYEFKE